MAKRCTVSLSKLLRGHPSPKPKPASQTIHKDPPRATTQLGRDSPAPPSFNSQYSPSIPRHPIGEALRTRSWTGQTRWVRSHSTGSHGETAQPELDVSKEVDLINRSFAEAREEIEMAMESKETVYFNEEAECAREAVKKVLGLYEQLLGRLEEKEKGSVQRSMGLKIEQLKAELQQLDD